MLVSCLIFRDTPTKNLMSKKQQLYPTQTSMVCPLISLHPEQQSLDGSNCNHFSDMSTSSGSFCLSSCQSNL